MLQAKHKMLLVSMLSWSLAWSQTPGRYISPMDHAIDLSGNFMEPRGDHFHSGLDIRTGGREGCP